jgi:hypothetical protein
MTGQVSGAIGTGTVSSENREKIVVTDVSCVNEEQFLGQEYVMFDPPRHGDWMIVDISEDEDKKTITVERDVDVEVLERQTSRMSMLSPRLTREQSRLVGDKSSSTPADTTPAKEYAQLELSDDEELAGEPSVQGETRADTTVQSSLGEIVPPNAPQKRQRRI